MREIVNKLQENRQLERAKSIMESNGYEVSKESKNKRLKESCVEESKNSKEDIKESNLNESALDQLWDLYDSSPAVADAIEKIADELGIGTEKSPSEEEAKRILAAYKGAGNSVSPDDAGEMINGILDAIEDSADLESIISSVQTFEEAGLMTNNKGFVIKTKKGNTYQFSLLGSF